MRDARPAGLVRRERVLHLAVTAGPLRRLVFVAMPFGKKRDPRNACDIDFDRIYEAGIKPAFEGLPVEYIRADEERGGGIIHVPMFERLLLAEIAIVDVTSENANVFYELGVRHAARPYATIIIRGGDGGLPFDINMMRAIMYRLENGVLSDEEAKRLSQAIAARLQTALSEEAAHDSPLFQLIPQYPGIRLDAATTETFRAREEILDGLRKRLVEARRNKATGLADIVAIEDELGEISEANAEVIIDIVLSYRDIGSRAAFDRLIALVERMPASLRDRSVAVRQQFALALNRRNTGTDRHRSIDVLEALCAQEGESPETCGLLGRIYKDLYNEARAAGQKARAAGHLQKAIEHYRRGFEADTRDYYPGINLATLLTMEGSEESIEERRRIISTIAFAVERHDAADKNNHWTIATMLEAAVLGNDWKSANRALSRLLALTTLSPFDLQSTTRQLALLRSYEPRDIDLEEMDAIILELLASLPPEAVSEPLLLLPPATIAAYVATLSPAARESLRTVADPALVATL